MSHKHQPVPEGKDPGPWELAQKRAGFKDHLLAYVLVNGMMWIIWYLSIYQDKDLDPSDYILPWPIWTTLFWGIGLAWEFADAFLKKTANAVEDEYQKLKNQQHQ